MIGHQLVAITAERDRWQADMGAIAERAKRAETLARCRDSEASQLCREHEVTTHGPWNMCSRAELVTIVCTSALARLHRRQCIVRMMSAGREACHLSLKEKKDPLHESGGAHV